MLRYNEQSFHAISNQAVKAGDDHLLAVTYCTLVCIELMLKNKLAISGGHDIPSLLKTYGNIKTKHAATLISYSKQIRNKLQSLQTQNKKGLPQLAPADSYPYIRYLRHSNDFSSPSNDDKDVFALLNDARAVKTFLKKI